MTVNESGGGLESGARLVLTAGLADDAELVAVLLAVELVLASEQAAVAAQPRPGWRRAARQEGVGSARLLAAPDLRGLPR